MLPMTSWIQILPHRIIPIGTRHYIHTMKILLILCMVFLTTFGQNAWERPGCHRLGHTRTIFIPGCVAFQVTTNACRGFCESYAIPSSSYVMTMNPNHIITSRAECCGIADTHDVTVHVNCADGFRELTFKSAASCACSVCRT